MEDSATNNGNWYKDRYLQKRNKLGGYFWPKVVSKMWFDVVKTLKMVTLMTDQHVRLSSHESKQKNEECKQSFRKSFKGLDLNIEAKL